MFEEGNMYRYVWNAFLLLLIGTGFYFFVQLIFNNVSDPLQSSLALLMGCLFTAGIARELLIMSPTENRNGETDIQ